MNASHDRSPAEEAEPTFSPVENELPLRLHRFLHLAPSDGLGAGRRAIFYALVTWVPIMAWAAVTGHLWSGQGDEPLLQHYGVHVRCLIAIPLLILGEAQLHRTFVQLIPQFRAGGFIPSAVQSDFTRVIASVRGIRDVSLPWVFLVGIAIAWTLTDRWEGHSDELAWAIEGSSLGFGGMWFAYVVRPIFLALLLGWIWRLALVGYLFFRLGRMKLALVPTHPDRVAGLGFLQALPGGFSTVTFALSAVFASQWAHQILHHGVTIESLQLPIAALVLGWTCVLILPLLALAPLLVATKRTGLAAYSSLIAQHGRLVHRRWILREPVETSPLLDAPEIGAVADANVLYDVVRSMRPFPIGSRAILAIVIPLALPLLTMTALQIPLREILGKLVKVLI